MKVISSKDGALLSHYDKINDENDIPDFERFADLPPQIRSTPQQNKLIKNHTDANKSKIKGNLYLEDIFGFCRKFKKVTKILGSRVMLKTSHLQDIIYTSMDDDIKVTINNLYLFVANLIQSVETQLLFNEATQNNYKISYDEYYTERRVISDVIVQHDIGSVQQVNSPKYLISAHQTKNRTTSPGRKINIDIFDNVNL